MKILIGSLTYPLPNGVSASINTSADGFVKKGHQVRIVSPDYNVGKFRREHFPVSCSSLGRMITALFGKEERMFGVGAQIEIEAIVADFQPDAFWMHTLSWAKNAFEKAMLRSKKAKVLTYHTMVENYGRIYAGSLGAGKMVSRSREVGNSVDAVITPSHMMMEKLRSYGVIRPIIPIFTAVTMPKKPYSKKELAKRFKFSDEKSLLIHVGRVSKEKNIPALLRMAKNLKNLGVEFTLLFVGPGDIDETMEEAKSLSIAENVICTGSLKKEEALMCYSAADIFVFASQTETQGLVVSEAMLAGLPVVALKSPIQEEVYPHRVAKIVDHESQFAGAVKELLEDESEKKKLSELGKEFAKKNFSFSKMISQQIAVFESLIKNN